MSSNSDDESLPTEVAKQFIALQSKELDARITEARHHAEDINNQKEVALESIRSQAQNLREQRDTIGKKSARNKYFLLALSLLGMILFWYWFIKTKPV